MRFTLWASLLLISSVGFTRVIPLNQSQKSASAVEHVKTKFGDTIYHDIQFELNQVEATSLPGHPEFTFLSETNVPFTKNIGEARVPYKSILVEAMPDDITVTVDPRDAVDVDVVSSPGQPEACRCAVKANKWVGLHRAVQQLSRIDYLGKYRGTPMSRVTIFAAEADALKTTFYPNLRAQVAARAFSAINEDIPSNYDYLIVTPSSLLAGLTEFVAYKSAKGLRIKTVTKEEIGTAVSDFHLYFKNEYVANGYKYVLIVGTDDLIPTHKVGTAFDPETPSDYTYFLMDQNDIIPDVQYGRVVASTLDEVKRQTKKWMNYEDHNSEAAQYLQMIGIASSEGENPSDEEYVRGIQSDMTRAYRTASTHFNENDVTSRPRDINNAFNRGAGYLIYVGHGSGDSWASTNVEYTTADIKKMKNASVLKPIIIDVACQNGILKKNYFGETFMNATDATGQSIGASMYFGGSVNISWNPPAIMATGMIKRTISENLTKVGDAILAGQLYLFENHSDLEEVQDNFEWYHLFGDPSSKIYFR